MIRDCDRDFKGFVRQVCEVIGIPVMIGGKPRSKNPELSFDERTWNL